MTPAPEFFVGNHPLMLEVFHQIRKVAVRDGTVLITGESGVGKELVAREIHRRSPRAGPFVAVNCGALPEGLLESEIFGHERGAFTGATDRRIGCFERAAGGTLFLDEIGDASAATQVKLLRVLDHHEFERMGGSRTLHTDARIVAATNQNLNELRGQGRFRSDLFHRLNVFPVRVPALHERRTDLPALIEGLCRREALDLHWTQAALLRAQRHRWLGNVREVLNVLERLSLLCEDAGPVTVELLERALNEHNAGSPSVRVGFEQHERDRLEELLLDHRFNVSAVARRLGMSRGALRHRLARYGLAR
jgi:DNA-binding NtrC family response regulator